MLPLHECVPDLHREPLSEIARGPVTAGRRARGRASQSEADENNITILVVKLCDN